MATAQMNVRIDESLKARGDVAFGKAGYSPSAVVRGMWLLAQRYEADAHSLGDILNGLFGEDASDVDTWKKERLAALDKASSMWAGFAQESAACDALSEELVAAQSNGELRDILYSDYGLYGCEECSGEGRG